MNWMKAASLSGFFPIFRRWRFWISREANPLNRAVNSFSILEQSDG